MQSVCETLVALVNKESDPQMRQALALCAAMAQSIERRMRDDLIVIVEDDDGQGTDNTHPLSD